MHRLAVLGHPVAHSQSPRIHQAFASQVGIDIRYDKIQPPLDGFEARAREFIAAGAKGFNITVPFKFDAYQLADTVSDSARIAEAVNTIKVQADGKLVGDNTDGPGLVTDITVNLGWRLRGKRVLVLGAGGAVRGVLGHLLAAEPECLHLWNRTPAKSAVLVDQFDGLEHFASDDELESAYDLVINGTSAGLTGRLPAIPARVIGRNSCVYDMVYSDQTTDFNQWCQANSALATSDGLGMLVEQAALAFEIWFGLKVKTEPVIAMLRAT
jgi:shikimate dehydrogenase